MKVQGGDVMKRGVGLLMKRLEGLTRGEEGVERRSRRRTDIELTSRSHQSSYYPVESRYEALDN